MPKLARAIMVQGTASSVGKSLIVTALCRFFRREGVRVAPFKAQNMALNSAVTPDGLEIGRAQAVQADAAGLSPAVEMNPILLKPEGDSRSQVVVMGKPIGSMSAVEYQAHKPALQRVIAQCIEELKSRYDLVVIEGAGSPAEINLKARDIVNMHVARVADAPVLLVGDIDRGGVFASFVGTLELLEPDERERIVAFVINKFRGDVSLLAPGLDFLGARTGKAVLGVLPYISGLRIADEDSVSLEDRSRRQRSGPDQIDIAVVRLPRISNYDDFLPLEHETGVVVRFVEHPEKIGGADLVILPGSKNTASDLAWLRQTGIAAVIAERARYSEPVLGVCGGCQMLGETIEDPHGVESSEQRVGGLQLLPLVTRFERQKVTARVVARPAGESILSGTSVGEIAGYEIHMGTVERTGPCAHPFDITSRNGNSIEISDGAIDPSGCIVGTMIHGIFENADLRRAVTDKLRRRKGLPVPVLRTSVSPSVSEYDRVEAMFREHIDKDLLWGIARLER